MKLRNVLILVILSFCTSLVAQKPHVHRKGTFDIVQIRKEKSQYLTKELSLTVEEVRAFLPLEQEYTTKKYEISREARHKIRDLRQKETKSEEDYKMITQLSLDVETREASLQKEYFDKFTAVLSAQKIEKYRHADQEFMRILLERRNNRK